MTTDGTSAAIRRSGEDAGWAPWSRDAAGRQGAGRQDLGGVSQRRPL